MDSEDTIRVILAVGENRSLAGKLCQELDGSDGIVLTGGFAGGEEMSAVAAASADVLVVAGEAGANTARRLAEAVPGVPVVLITDNVIRDLVPAVKAGVAGLLPADVAGSDLIETIRRVHLWSGRSAALV